MLTTPQTPINEQPSAGQEPVQQPAQQPIQQAPMPQQPMPQQQPVPRQPMPQPNMYQPAPQMSSYVAPASQAMALTPTSGQRLGLAVASLALLIPLLAIAIGVMTNLMPYVTAGVAITIGMFAVTLVCLVVVAVNILFNWDTLRPRR